MKLNKKLYPFLEDDDKKLAMTPDEIIDKELDFNESRFSEIGREKLSTILRQNKDSFSLYGEVGTCKSAKPVTFELKKNEGPFNIRPFPFSVQEKILIKKEVDQLIKLGIMKPMLSEFSSPCFLVKRYDEKSKQLKVRLVVDYRELNRRIVRPNFAQNLVRDAVHHIGFSGAKWTSLLDITKAYYSIPLSEECQRMCAYIPCAGMVSIVPTKLPMGLNISGSHYTTELARVLEDIPNYRDLFFPIVDDLLIYSKTESEHIEHIKQVLELLGKHGMKLNLKKCDLAKQKYVYMGYLISYDENGNPVVSIEKSKNEAIQKLPAPTSVKKVKSFCGMVLWLSKFLPDLATLLIPMFQLTKKPSKNKKFLWTPECQVNFDRIKELIRKAPVQYPPTKDILSM